jgi:hypothetical protein
MAETTFLNAIQSYLAGAGLSPTPASIGPAEPIIATDLPALVLSLERTRRAGSGLGGGQLAQMEGALGVDITIDLAAPVLPEEPSFRLLSDNHRELVLYHGGLVRADGTGGPLGGGDLRVRVAGNPRVVVGGTPGAGQVACDPLVGRLTFGDALPDGGLVEVHYSVGRWERRTETIEGDLRIDVCAGGATDAVALSDAVVAALLAPAAERQVLRLLRLEVGAVGSIAAADAAAAGARRRSLRFRFGYERLIDRADSSGGIIQRIPTITRLPVATVDRDGAITEVVVTEESA